MSKNHKQETPEQKMLMEEAPLIIDENFPKVEAVKEKAETKADHADHKLLMPIETQQERHVIKTALQLNKVHSAKKPALIGAIEQLINDNAGNTEFISALHQLINCFGSLHLILNALAVHHKQAISGLGKQYPSEFLVKLKEIIYG